MLAFATAGVVGSLPQCCRAHIGKPTAAQLVLRSSSSFVGAPVLTASSRSPAQKTSASHFGFPMTTQANWRRWKFGEEKPEPSKNANDKAELFVMLPLDIIAVGEQKEGQEVSFIHSIANDSKLLDRALATLKRTGVEGVMMDVWWGIAERHGPEQYDFAGYMELFKKAKRFGLKVQAVMSFHAGGGNVGDGSTDIPLPQWVLKAGEAVGDEIFYTDKGGGRDHEYISLGCDHEPVLAGRTPIQAYTDFVAEFKKQCIKNNLWGGTVTEICLGLGPCGELRYPAYQEAPEKWSFLGRTYGQGSDSVQQQGVPGIGEFQCYDKYMLADLKRAATKRGNEDWGVPPGIGAGVYASAPWETSFLALTEGAGWRTPYGQFFLEWYSGALVKHAEDVLDEVLPIIGYKKQAQNLLDVNNDGKIDFQDMIAVFTNGSASPEEKPPVEVAVKVSGIHWWYNSPSHAAEMTAGYYNYFGHDGYEPIVRCLKARQCALSFTCIEMSDTDNPEYRQSSPEGLVRQVVGTAQRLGVPMLGENALEGGIYNQQSLDTMLRNSVNFERITLLRLYPWMFDKDESAPEGLQVKQPLRNFIHASRKQEGGEHSSQNGAGLAQEGAELQTA